MALGLDTRNRGAKPSAAPNRSNTKRQPAGRGIRVGNGAQSNKGSASAGYNRLVQEKIQMIDRLGNIQWQESGMAEPYDYERLLIADISNILVPLVTSVPQLDVSAIAGETGSICTVDEVGVPAKPQGKKQRVVTNDVGTRQDTSGVSIEFL